MTLLIVILLGFVVAATALYGPQAAALVEMFPTRIRYTAMSFPYHVGTGWVGGFLPVTSFALVAITGNIYSGLWYAVVFTAISVVVSLFFLKETRAATCRRSRPPSGCRSAARLRRARGRSAASSYGRRQSPARGARASRRR